MCLLCTILFHRFIKEFCQDIKAVNLLYSISKYLRFAKCCHAFIFWIWVKIVLFEKVYWYTEKSLLHTENKFRIEIQFYMIKFECYFFFKLLSFIKRARINTPLINYLWKHQSTTVDFKTLYLTWLSSSNFLTFGKFLV